MKPPNDMIKYRRDLWKMVNILGNAAEIGVAEGLFSADILSWPRPFEKVYMVDRWEQKSGVQGDSSNPQTWHLGNEQAARERVSVHGQRAVFLKGESVEMSKLVPDNTLSFLYIDADHSYAGVTADLKAWYPKVKRNGIVALHDYENPAYGVKPAVKDFCSKRNITIHLLPEDKMEDAGAFFIC